MLILSGCGSKPSVNEKSSDTVAETAAEAKEKANRRIIESGKLTLEATDESGNPAWKVNGKSARAGIEETGDNQFFIETVTGEVFSKGEVASTFIADSAKAATETKKLVLNGNVKITSLGQNTVKTAQSNDKKLTLTADKITWMEDKQLFAASGNVQIDSPDYHLGNMDEVWATPDLSKIGTPNKFK